MFERGSILKQRRIWKEEDKNLLDISRYVDGKILLEERSKRSAQSVALELCISTTVVNAAAAEYKDSLKSSED